MLDEIERHLTGEYLTVYISFEGIGDAIFNDESKFSSGLIELFSESLRMNHPGIADDIRQRIPRFWKGKGGWYSCLS